MKKNGKKPLTGAGIRRKKDGKNAIGKRILMGLQARIARNRKNSFQGNAFGRNTAGKTWRTFASLACIFALLLGITVPAQAAEKYTYTVRIFAGAQGTIGGGDVLVFSGLEYGQRVSFNQRDVSLLDGSKYYIRGVRESGKDNNTVSAISFRVTGDADYVVAYGILGNAVAYTVNYVDADGNTLAESETYYGNIGDKPVIAYLYIDGYEPQAYSLGLTLSANAADNVFTFVYTPVEELTPLTPEAVEGGAGAGAAGAEGGAAGAGAAGAGAGAAGAGAADAGAGAAGAGAAGAGAGTAGAGAGDAGAAGSDAGTAIPDEEVPLEGPPEYQDLDDEEVPLADVDAGTKEAFVNSEDYAKWFRNLPRAALLGLFSMGTELAALGFWYFMIVRKREKPKKE